jgi:putative membrane protein
MIERWSIHPSIPIGLAILCGAYALAAGPLRRRYGWSKWPPDGVQVATFSLGLLVFFLALTGPIHDLSDSYLFSVHMVQHLIITVIAPPLVLLGVPGWMIRAPLRWPIVGRLTRFLTRAPVAFLLFNLTLAIWHIPSLYNNTLLVLRVHILEHLLFIATAFLAWWPILSPIPEMRLRPPLQVLYLVLLTLPMKALGALITMAGGVLYPAYALAPRVFGLGAYDDQKLGGIIMWVPSGFLFWTAAAIVFYRWWRSEHRDKTPLAGEARSGSLRVS